MIGRWRRRALDLWRQLRGLPPPGFFALQPGTPVKFSAALVRAGTIQSVVFATDDPRDPRGDRRIRISNMRSDLGARTIACELTNLQPTRVHVAVLAKVRCLDGRVYPATLRAESTQ